VLPIRAWLDNNIHGWWIGRREPTAWLPYMDCRAGPNRHVYGSRPATLNHVEQQIRDASAAVPMQFLRTNFESMCTKLRKGVKDEI